MAKSTHPFSLRVTVIATMLVVGLGALIVVVNRLGRPSTPPVAPLEDVGEGESLDAAAVEPPTADNSARPTMTLQLFVVDAMNRRLVTRIERVAEPTTPVEQLELALARLSVAADSAMPPDTVLREAWVADGVAYLDFGARLPAQLDGGSLSELLFVYGIVGTLTSSIPTITAVQFLVEGRTVDTLTGHADLSRPVEPLADWVF